MHKELFAAYGGHGDYQAKISCRSSPLLVMVASADAALVRAESGVCKPQEESAGLERGQAKPSHGERIVLAARRWGGAPKQRSRRALKKAPAGASV